MDDQVIVPTPDPVEVARFVVRKQTALSDNITTAKAADSCPAPGCILPADHPGGHDMQDVDDDLLPTE